MEQVCVRGHSSPRRKNGNCIQCERERYKTSEKKRTYQKEISRQRRERIKNDPALAEAQREYMREYRRQNKDRLAALQAEYQKRPGAAARFRLKRKGIDPEKHTETVLNATACEICGGPPDGRWKTFHVDHCHETGGFRGMLCSACNTGLANFKDDPEIMKKAAAYIEQYRKMLPNECL